MANDESQITAEDLELVKKYEDTSRLSADGFLVDFYGSRIALEFGKHLPTCGRVLPLPVPNDGYFHGVMEYLGAAVAFSLSGRKSFTAVELGAGFGPWVVRSALVAQRLGIKHIAVVGVEADELHFDWMRRHFRNNNLITASGFFSSFKIDLHHAAISETEEFLYFPDLGKDHQDWGAAAAFDSSNCDYRGLKQKPLKCAAIPINRLLSHYPAIDFLHIDIQGLEFRIVQCAIEQLNKKVRVMVIGTHSRKIEGDLIELLFRNKWQLRNETPCRFTYNRSARSLEAMTLTDGTQIWINTS